jgi:hypothetical protein
MAAHGAADGAGRFRPRHRQLTIRPIIAPLLALLASALLFVARFASDYEESRDHPTGVRMALMGASIGVPLVHLWVRDRDVGKRRRGALGSGARAARHRFRCWPRFRNRAASPACSLPKSRCGRASRGSPPSSGILSLVIGAVIAVAAYLHQREIDLKLRIAVEEGVRLQTRAEEILADYEETGQGWFWKPTAAAS